MPNANRSDAQTAPRSNLLRTGCERCQLPGRPTYDPDVSGSLSATLRSSFSLSSIVSNRASQGLSRSAYGVRSAVVPVNDETRQTRIHRGHRIVATQLGGDWVGTVYAPGSNAIVGSVEGGSAQEVMIRGIEAINALLSARR